MKRRIRMTKLGKVVTTIIILLVGVLLYIYSGVWGEEQTKMAIILCMFSWFYLFFVQIAFLYFVWDK